MNDDDKLQQQIADIGTRYLKRTLSDIEQLRSFLRDARGGSDDALIQLGQLAHKIHGSGAMFGFDLVSERAYAIEQLARDRRGESTLGRIDSGVAALEEEVRRQAHSRGVQ